MSDHQSITQYQFSLWSLHYLYTFQLSLKTTLDSINDAKRELFKQIDEVMFLIIYLFPVTLHRGLIGLLVVSH